MRCRCRTWRHSVTCTWLRTPTRANRRRLPVNLAPWLQAEVAMPGVPMPSLLLATISVSWCSRQSMDGDVFGLDALNRMPAMPVILPHHRLPTRAVRRRVGHQPRRHAHCLDPARKAQRQREEPVMERSASQARASLRSIDLCRRRRRFAAPVDQAVLHRAAHRAGGHCVEFVRGACCCFCCCAVLLLLQWSLQRRVPTTRRSLSFGGEALASPGVAQVHRSLRNEPGY